MLALLLTFALSATPAPDSIDPVPPPACRKPVCMCVDATKPDDCLDDKACETFCADHGGRAELHKKHRRHHHAK